MESDNLTLSDYLAVVRRRLLMIVAVVVLTTGSALLISTSQQRLYRGSATVAVSVPPTLPNSTNRSTSNNPQTQQRFGQTQALLAQTLPVASAALKRANVSGRTPQQLLDKSVVTADPNADLLTFQVEDTSRSLAARLATAYANAFVVYARDKNAGVAQALQSRYEAQARQARRAIATASARELRVLVPQLKSANKILDELTAYQAELDKSYALGSASDSASQVQPETKRNAVLGAGIGLLLGLLLAFLYDAVDSRVRSAQELTTGLPLRVLGRLPKPPRAVRQRNELVMVAQRDGPQAEAFRALRARMDYANSDRAHLVMVTSAVEREGKSTTVANLAVAFAEAGRHVVLVDLDMARGSIHRFFGLARGPGMSDIVAGDHDVTSALAAVELAGAAQPSTNGGVPRRNGHARGGGSLRVLPVGDTPLDAVAVLTSPKLPQILRSLRAESELVLLDAAPLLPVSDGLILSSHVDGVLAVAHAGMLRRAIVEEFDVVLDALPAAKLGLVLTGVPRADTYGYPRYGAKASPTASPDVGAPAAPPQPQNKA